MKIPTPLPLIVLILLTTISIVLIASKSPRRNNKNSLTTPQNHPPEKQITVIVDGFVGLPGEYKLTLGSTISDSLIAAEGHGVCEHCEKEFPKHPTYSKPPLLYRKGEQNELLSSLERKKWLEVKLVNGDRLYFGHVWF